MKVILDGDSAKLVSERVKSGHYSSPSDVVRAGLRALESSEQGYAIEVTDLEQKLREASASPLIPYRKSLLDQIRKARKAHAP